MSIEPSYLLGNDWTEKNDDIQFMLKRKALIPDTRLQAIVDAYQLFLEGRMRAQELYNTIEDAGSER